MKLSNPNFTPAEKVEDLPCMRMPLFFQGHFHPVERWPESVPGGRGNAKSVAGVKVLGKLAGADAESGKSCPLRFGDPLLKQQRSNAFAMNCRLHHSPAKHSHVSLRRPAST